MGKMHRITKTSYWVFCNFKIGYEKKENALAQGGAFYIRLGFIEIAIDYR